MKEQQPGELLRLAAARRLARHVLERHNSSGEARTLAAIVLAVDPEDVDEVGRIRVARGEALEELTEGAKGEGAGETMRGA